MISPSDLEYFIEISSTKNLSRAAERIGISQPSLTLAIKRIEDELGVSIFIRSKKGVSLTKAGAHLLKHAKHMQQFWGQIKSEASASVNEVTGVLKLGCHPSVGLYTLDKFLPKVLEKNSELDFELTHDLSRKVTEQIISLELDIGLVINPVKHPDLVIQDLFDDIVTLWESKKTYQNHDVLICDPSLLQTQDIQKKLKKKGFSFSRVITSNSLENIANLINSGAGVGILPTRVANKIAGKDIKEVKNAPKFKDILSVIYRIENRNVKSIQYLVGEIIKSLK